MSCLEWAEHALQKGFQGLQQGKEGAWESCDFRCTLGLVSWQCGYTDFSNAEWPTLHLDAGLVGCCCCCCCCCFGLVWLLVWFGFFQCQIVSWAGVSTTKEKQQLQQLMITTGEECPHSQDRDIGSGWGSRQITKQHTFRLE